MREAGNLTNHRFCPRGEPAITADAPVPGDNQKTRFLPRLKRLGLPDEMVAELLNESIVVPYGKGLKPFAQGAPANVLMLVLNGVIKVYCSHGNTRRFLVQLAGPGDLIGYSDFIDSKGRRGQVFEAEALTNCTVALIFRHRIVKLLQGFDNAALLALLEQSNTFWSWIAYRYASLMSLSYRERMEVVISEIAGRFGIRDARGVMLTLELGHEEWAELIGSSRPMASRLLADMVRGRILSREGKRYIVLNGTDLEGSHYLLPRAGQEAAASQRA